MKKKIYASCLMVFFVCAIAQFTLGQGFAPNVQNRLKAVMDSFQNNPVNPFIGGMSVAVKVDGLASWQSATGYAARSIDEHSNLLPGGTPFTVNTLSRIYSITKTFTAALVLELAKEGIVRLDDSVNKYLPLKLINPLLNSNVTIRQLLGHTSGYSDYTGEFDLQIAVAAQPARIWTPYEMLAFVHQVSEPGTTLHYSSTNYVMLGAVIEVITGRHVETLYRERFFRPLGLDSMFLAIREKNPTHIPIASAHDNISPFNPVFLLTGQPLFPDTITNIIHFPLTAISSLAFTGGGIISNAANLANWSSYLFSGRATGQAILDTMLTSISSVQDEDGDRLGYGLIRTTKISATETFIGHDGNAPGYRSIMFYQPEKKLTLVILTNFHGADIYAVARAMYAAIPDFTCGAKTGADVNVCFWGKDLCIPRVIASLLIPYGATIGKCGGSSNSLVASNFTIGRNATFRDNLIAESRLGVYPNPFKHTISFTFMVSEAGPVNLRLYDINGKLQATVFNGFVQKGSIQKVEFDGGTLPAGIYISRLQTSYGSFGQKLVRSR